VRLRQSLKTAVIKRKREALPAVSVRKNNAQIEPCFVLNAPPLKRRKAVINI
jgi:hypothetical protein